jgi:hypothetical protein
VNLAEPDCDFEGFSLKSVPSSWFSVRLAAGGLDASGFLSLESQFCYYCALDGRLHCGPGCCMDALLSKTC